MLRCPSLTPFSIWVRTRASTFLRGCAQQHTWRWRWEQGGGVIRGPAGQRGTVGGQQPASQSGAHSRQRQDSRTCGSATLTSPVSALLDMVRGRCPSCASSPPGHAPRAPGKGYVAQKQQHSQQRPGAAPAGRKAKRSSSRAAGHSVLQYDAKARGGVVAPAAICATKARANGWASGTQTPCHVAWVRCGPPWGVPPALPQRSPHASFKRKRGAFAFHFLLVENNTPLDPRPNPPPPSRLRHHVFKRKRGVGVLQQQRQYHAAGAQAMAQRQEEASEQHKPALGCHDALYVRPQAGVLGDFGALAQAGRACAHAHMHTCGCTGRTQQMGGARTARTHMHRCGCTG